MKNKEFISEFFKYRKEEVKFVITELKKFLYEEQPKVSFDKMGLFTMGSEGTIYEALECAFYGRKQNINQEEMENYLKRKWKRLKPPKVSNMNFQQIKSKFFFILFTLCLAYVFEMSIISFLELCY